LSSLIDVEIRGILAHAWEHSTAEQLLRDSCWIQELHPDTEAKHDLHSFQLRAWCSAPERIHQRMGFIILERGLPVEGASLTKQALAYPIEITTLSVASPSTVEGSPPPPPADGSQRHDCWFR
jgi:hypothetical protein